MVKGNREAFSRRYFLQLSGMVTAGAVLAACAPVASTGGAGEAAPAAQEAVNIRVHMPAGAYGDFAQTRADKFHAEQTDVMVTIESIPGGEFFTKVRAMFATQQLGDICWMHNVAGQMQDLLHRNVFQPIDDLISAENFDIKAYLPTVIDTMTYDGKLMGLCFHAHPGNGHLITNLDMFEEAGINPDFDSQTFDDVVAAAQKLTVRNGSDVEVWGYGPGLWYQPLECTARYFDSELISSDGTKSLIDTPETRQAIQWAYDMMYKHEVAPSADQVEDSIQAMWLGGKVAAWRGSAHLVAALKSQVGDRFRWSITPLPPSPNGARGHDTTVHLMHMTALSKQVQAAWPFLKYMTNHDAGVEKVLMGAGAPGGRYDCNEDPQVLEYLPLWSIVAKAFDYAAPPVNAANLHTPEAVAAVDNSLQNLWLNTISVEEAIVKTHEELQAILDKPVEI